MKVEPRKRRRTKRTNPIRNARRRERRWNLELAIQLGIREPPSTSTVRPSQISSSVNPTSSVFLSSSTPSSSSLVSADPVSETIEAAGIVPNASRICHFNLLPPTDPNRPFKFFDWDASFQQLRSRRNRRRRRANRGPNFAEMELYFPEDRIDQDFSDHNHLPVDVPIDLIANQPINLDLVPHEIEERIPDELRRRMEMDRIFSTFAPNGNFDKP